MRMAFWFVVLCAAGVGAVWLADYLGWIDLAKWARELQDTFHVTQYKVNL